MDKKKSLRLGKELRKKWYDGTLNKSEMSEEMLCALLTYENEKIMKGKPYDREITEYCNDALIERQRIFTEKDFEGFEDQLFEILHGRRANISRLAKVKMKRRFFKPIAVAAACIIVVFSIQITSSAVGGNFFDRISQWGKGMIAHILGREMEKEDVNVVGSKAHTYKDIKEFQKKEDLNIFIPESVDSNVIAKIIYSFQNEESIIVHYENDYLLRIEVGNASQIPDNSTHTLYINNNVEYYVDVDYSTILWAADNNLYRLKCNFDSDKYKEIINSIVGD